MTQTTYFSLSTHAKQLSLVTFCETTAGIGKNESVTDVRAYVLTKGQTEVKSEIVIKILPDYCESGQLRPCHRMD